ncbi:MAG: phosphatidate cytidylyltransferase [Oscillospiraceae bacterium]
MKTRVVTSLLGTVVLVVALLLYKTFYFNVVLSLIAIIAISELFNSLFKQKKFIFLFLNYTIPLYFIILPNTYRYDFLFYYLFLLSLMNVILLLKYHESVEINQMMLFILASILISVVLNLLVVVRDIDNDLGVLFLLLSLCSAWISDIGAYFSGYFFGKRKLSPKISPEKTVEGAVGGVFLSVLVSFLATVITNYIFNLQISVVFTLTVSLCASIIGIIGDLMASIIKRQNNIKDFGDVMPGHGGIIDRFDSVFFTLPTVYVMFKIFELLIF